MVISIAAKFNHYHLFMWILFFARCVHVGEYVRLRSKEKLWVRIATIFFKSPDFLALKQHDAYYTRNCNFLLISRTKSRMMRIISKCRFITCITVFLIFLTGLWVFPMVQWQRISKIENQLMTFHCSMLDACTPYPVNASDTIAYIMDNFDRHYTSNRAPFPIFLHEAWLKDKNR